MKRTSCGFKLAMAGTQLVMAGVFLILISIQPHVDLWLRSIMACGLCLVAGAGLERASEQWNSRWPRRLVKRAAAFEERI